MKLEEMSRDERSLLLYLETRMVDYCSKIDSRHLNNADWGILKKWNDSGFIKYGRICMCDSREAQSHYCEFSEEAWVLAHAERRARAARAWKTRLWKTTLEERNS